ncbi:response regulator [Catenovulum sp. 2E275]|uniref:response regulator n=1 Tax=Catenovulum sp. 2E275 TaxID=2980497 RepID=UPI0021CDF48C|nr:response regulator [Catenovulum sp. 2E275]MCU4675002.1 response regulator [Catenovulum sp. 2E275]
MIQDFVKYSKVLIIDDQALAQAFLKQSLEKIGFEIIQIAESAKHALRLTEERSFDLIICSFNLSRDRDGYHLFEELKNKGAVRLDTTFIFTSAETDAALVNSVIELQPDDFLAKPFTARELSERLVKVLKRKQKLKKVYQALENKDLNNALKQLDDMLANPKQASLYPLIMRLKGDILLLQKDYSTAARFYFDIINVQKFTWAMIGLAKAYLGLNKEDAGKAILDKLVKKPETRLAALDLLAQYYINHDEFDLAYQQFKDAKALSPRNIKRHQCVINLARMLHDHGGQYEAAKTMLRVAKHSLHDNEDLYLTVARASIDYALTLTEQESVSIARQTEKYLNTLRREFNPSAESKNKIAIVQARLHYIKDEQDKAKQLIESLKFDQYEANNFEDYLDRAKAFHELGFQDKAVGLLEDIPYTFESDEVGEKILNRFIAQEKQEKRDIPFSPRQLNNIAVQLYNQKQIEPAMQAFGDSLKLMPKNVRIALNLLQALVEQKHKNELSDYQETLYWKSIQVITEQSLDNQQQTRYESLIARSELYDSQKNQHTA